jgi:hypothetical protein
MQSGNFMSPDGDDTLIAISYPHGLDLAPHYEASAALTS